MRERQVVTSYLDAAGDCEVRRIEFDGLDARIFVYDPFFDRTFFIDLYEVTIFMVHSCHMQNVIASVNISKKFSCLPDDVAGLSSIVNSIHGGYGQSVIDTDATTLYIEPIAGCSIFAQFGSYSMEYDGALK